MRTLTYFVACSVDGFIARASGAFDFFIGEGDHIADQAASYPETIPAHLRQSMGIDAPNRHWDTVLMGRATYEVGLPIGLASPYPHMAQYVFSTTTTPPSGEVHHVRDDPLGTVRALKQRPGLGIWLCGGGLLASALLPEIDELVLKVHPVLVHEGIRLFEPPAPEVRLEPTGSHAYASGVRVQRYRVLHAGA